MLLAIFAAAVLPNLWRERRILCSCGGIAAQAEIGIATVLRIGVLGAAAVVVMRDPGPGSLVPLIDSSADIVVAEGTVILSMLLILALLSPVEMALRELAGVMQSRREFERTAVLT